MRRLFLSLLLLLPTTLGAQTIEFDPPWVTSHTAATVSVRGVWNSSCVPQLREAATTASTITIRLFVPTEGGCGAAITPYRHEVYLGLLQAGVYDVIVRLDEGANTRVLAQTKLQVAEAGLPWTLTPRAVTTVGRTEVVVRGIDTTCAPFVDPCLAPPVLVDGAPATNSRILGRDSFAFTPPQHAPGAADVVIAGVRAKAALRYYDPDATSPAPAIFEPVLIPLLFNGPGQFGSQWVTEGWLRNESSQAVVPWRQNFGVCLAATIGQPCPYPAGVVMGMALDSKPGGLLLYAPRDQAAQLTYSLLVRDLSRQSQDLGTAIPVVRERDWRASAFSILNVPADPRYRHTLRVYAIDTQSTVVAVRFYSIATGLDVMPPIIVTLRAVLVDEPAFAQLNVPALPPNDPVRIEIQPSAGSLPPARYWAFVSTTNNETQYVTVLSPE